MKFRVIRHANQYRSISKDQVYGTFDYWDETNIESVKSIVRKRQQQLELNQCSYSKMPLVFEYTCHKNTYKYLRVCSFGQNIY